MNTKNFGQVIGIAFSVDHKMKMKQKTKKEKKISCSKNLA